MPSVQFGNVIQFDIDENSCILSQNKTISNYFPSSCDKRLGFQKVMHSQSNGIRQNGLFYSVCGRSWSSLIGKLNQVSSKSSCDLLNLAWCQLATMRERRGADVCGAANAANTDSEETCWIFQHVSHQAFAVLTKRDCWCC